VARSARSVYIFPAALLLAWFFDFLFWKKPWGVSVPVFSVFVITVGLLLAQHNESKPANGSYLLLAPIIFFALVSMVRQEPFTLLVSRLLVVVLSAILALTLNGGQWLHYSFADFATGFLTLLPRGIILFAQFAPKNKGRERGRLRRVIFPVLRGLLVGLPLLWFFAALLSSSDPFFAKWLENIFSFLNVENLFEYFFRGFYIIILSYLLAAAFSYALLGSQNEKLRGIRNPLVKPFLGFGEGLTIIASINILFTAFVAIQFRYFFGGSAQVVDNPAGLTFAEYARQGFGELVVVAISSLLLFIGLSSITRRETQEQHIWFSSFGIALFALVSVILVSAYQRLLLYESAYGFTRMRIYPHVFMVWLALLLLAVVLLELQNRQRVFAQAVLLAVMGFAGTLALLNVDGFIARSNIARAELGYDLDHSYLATLSHDAVPALADEYAQLLEQGDQLLAEKVVISLVCLYEVQENVAAEIPWQGWTLSRHQADNIIGQFISHQTFPTREALPGAQGGWSVDYGGQTYECQADRAIQ
jgi:hypothetical protein